MSWVASYRAAIRELSTPSLHGEILKLENSIKHLRRSNEELREHGNSNEEDASWIVSVISDNEDVIAKQNEQIELVKQQLVEQGATGERADYLNMLMNVGDTRTAKGTGAHNVESERNDGGERTDLEESNDGVYL